jgi:GNAT superfamily N-acetyltransferase
MVRGDLLIVPRSFLRRLLSSHRFVVYYYDPAARGCSAPLAQSLPDRLTVARITSQEEMDPEDWQRIVNLWKPELTRRKFSERSRKGAAVWLVRSEGKLAGYGWTIIGCTIKPHFVPFGSNDVHLFDFVIFPEYWGQGINPLFVTYILDQLAAESRTRTYIEAAEWNHSQLTSLGKTALHLLGVARKVSLFGRTFVERERTPSGSESARVCKKSDTPQSEWLGK